MSRNSMKFTPLGKSIKEMSLRGWRIVAREFGAGVLIANPHGQTITIFQSGNAKLGNHLGQGHHDKITEKS